MNRHIFNISLLVSLLLLVTGCEKDQYEEEPTICSLVSAPLRYTSAGIWSELYTSGDIYLEGMAFSHKYVAAEPDDQGVMTGFVASHSSDNIFHEGQMGDYPYVYCAITGIGVSGRNQPYLVACVDPAETEDTPFEKRSVRIWREDYGGEPKTFLPYTVFIANTGYAFYAMQRGIGEADKFRAGDWFLLTIHGVRPDDTESTVDYYLADLRSNHPEDWHISSHWENVDLTSLGIVKGIYFTLSSSDTGLLGMRTPPYFALDKLSFFPKDKS